MNLVAESVKNVGRLRASGMRTVACSHEVYHVLDRPGRGRVSWCASGLVRASGPVRVGENRERVDRLFLLRDGAGRARGLADRLQRRAVRGDEHAHQDRPRSGAPSGHQWPACTPARSLTSPS